MKAQFPNIIFEDTHLIVLDKPAGLLSQGESTGSENLVDWLRHYLGRNYVGLVHRLDRNTSGIMVVAKRSKAANRLTQALQNGSFSRWYLGWLEGQLTKAETWRGWLIKDETENLVTVVTSNRRGAKEAELKVEPIKELTFRSHPLTLAQFSLATGRSHQIRAQAAFVGMPIVGDKKYGSRLRFIRPALHSYRLRFPHPMGETMMEFTAPLPKDLEDLGTTLRGSSQ